jgi:hypothetical protein
VKTKWFNVNIERFIVKSHQFNVNIERVYREIESVCRGIVRTTVCQHVRCSQAGFPSRRT